MKISHNRVVNKLLFIPIPEIIKSFKVLNFLLFCITGDWTQGFMHARQVFYH
jgi:hypothetical protein